MPRSWASNFTLNCQIMHKKVLPHNLKRKTNGFFCQNADTNTPLMSKKIDV